MTRLQHQGKEGGNQWEGQRVTRGQEEGTGKKLGSQWLIDAALPCPSFYAMMLPASEQREIISEHACSSRVEVPLGNVELLGHPSLAYSLANQVGSFPRMAYDGVLPSRLSL